MKKILAILIAILLIPTYVYAAAVTLSSTHYVAPGITMYKLASVNDADTFTVDGPIGGYWLTETDDPDTQATGGAQLVGMSAVQTTSGATHTFTFTVTEGAGTCNFFVIK